MQNVLEPQAKTKGFLDPKRCQKRECKQLLPDLEEEIENAMWAIFVGVGSAPTHRGSSSSTDVLVVSSTAVNMSVEKIVPTNMSVEKIVPTIVSFPSVVGIQIANPGTIGSLCFNESKARDFETLTDLVLTSYACPRKPSKESVHIF